MKYSKIVTLLFLAISPATFAQHIINWQNLDYLENGVYGISMEKAYRLLLNDKKPASIIVAVIDTGIDTLHEDLKLNLWRNTFEKGADEDKNGYIGDFYGWNFLGNRNGKNLIRDSYEFQRVFASLKQKYENTLPDDLKKENKVEYEVWLKAKTEVERTSIPPVNLILKKEFLNDPYSKRREIIGDNYFDIDDRYYGNNNLMQIGVINHGTHVAGIIGAVRGNGKGIDGVANSAKIMMIRAVPRMDEYDKDIALAIKYAVDNGAKVINMSFGKEFSPEQIWVEKAIRYAEKKDVLLIRGAGNDHKNIDNCMYYPTPIYLNGQGKASNVITVGASGPYTADLISPFSSYGKNNVDVFAPGVDIYSTVYSNSPILMKIGAKYEFLSGTSMATPVVSGLAAVIRAYYPQLSAKQVKYIIENSVSKIDQLVAEPGTNRKVYMKDLCSSGGIVNAYNAIIIANKLIENKL